jgi:hypothetical protein
LTKQRRTRVQRLERQLKQLKASNVEVERLLSEQIRIGVEHTIKINQLEKKLTKSISRLSHKFIILGSWSQNMSDRLFSLERKGFLRRLFKRVSV